MGKKIVTKDPAGNEVSYTAAPNATVVFIIKGGDVSKVKSANRNVYFDKIDIEVTAVTESSGAVWGGKQTVTIKGTGSKVTCGGKSIVLNGDMATSTFDCENTQSGAKVPVTVTFKAVASSTEKVSVGQ